MFWHSHSLFYTGGFAKKRQKKQKKYAYLYGCVRFGEDQALRFMLHASRNETREYIAYGVRPYNPQNPRLNDTVGQVLNPPSTGVHWTKLVPANSGSSFRQYSLTKTSPLA